MSAYFPFMPCPSVSDVIGRERSIDPVAVVFATIATKNRTVNVAPSSVPILQIDLFLSIPGSDEHHMLGVPTKVVNTMEHMVTQFEPSRSARPIWRHAEERPTAIAVADSNTRLSYAQLRDEVQTFAARLLDSGIKAGDPVIVLLDVCVESVVAYWALRAIGAVVVVGDPTARAPEIRYYMEKTGARDILAGKRAAEAMAPPPGAYWHTLVGSGAAFKWQLSARNDENLERVLPDYGKEPAIVLFSSGTTGKPKAILHSVDSANALHETLMLTWKLNPTDRVLGTLPFHTIYGIHFSAGSAIYAGASLHLLERFHPQSALEAIEKHGITTAALVPTMVLMMLNLEGNERFDLSSLRALYTASAPISEADIKRFKDFSGASLICNYAMSEIPGATAEPADEPHHEGSVGRICPHFEVAVRDNSGVVLPIGDVGEITLRGPTMMPGYLSDPEQTADRIRDGWIYTQDIGRIDEKGNVFLSGRTSEIIMRGGLNISPREVEAAFVQHPEVADVAVIGLPDEIYGQIVLGIVVLKQGVPRPQDQDTVRESLMEVCRANLARAKLPSRIAFLAELPRNAGGKVIRAQALEMIQNQSLAMI